MLRYGTYTRKSDDDRSVTEKSTTEQLAECAKLIKASDLREVASWEESKSARHPYQRPKYSEMISLLEKGKIDGIVCWHINRLVRNMEEGGKLAQLLIDGRLKEIRTPSAIYRTGDNIMPLVIEAASATQFSLDHSKVVRRGMDGSFRSGGCIHAAPQGYRNARDQLNLKKGTVEVDLDRFDMIQRAWKLMLTGSYTVSEVRRTLNGSWGYRTRKTKKGGMRPISYSGIYQVLKNPFYAGFVRVKGEWVAGRHEPMVTLAEFEQVQVLISKNSFSAPRVKEYSFTGIMRCIHCGQQITAERRILKNGTVWENYRCSDSKGACTKRGMSKAMVSRAVVGAMKHLQIEPEMLRIAGDNIREELKLSSVDPRAVSETQSALLRAVDQRLKRLDEMWISGVLTDSDRYHELESKELAVKSELSKEAARIEGEASVVIGNLERSLQFLATIQREFKTFPTERQKNICKALADEILFDGVAKTIQVRVRPLLNELVAFTREISPFEPYESGSGNTKEPAFVKSILYGGPEQTGVGRIAHVQRLLREEVFLGEIVLSEGVDTLEVCNTTTSHPKSAQAQTRKALRKRRSCTRSTQEGRLRPTKRATSSAASCSTSGSPWSTCVNAMKSAATHQLTED
ncbi:MAG: hypothetical protein GC165_00160 [Armatimonadetes bacterium]|nr:hypothetical protein [Armatimonadota bacterium]